MTYIQKYLILFLIGIIVIPILNSCQKYNGFVEPLANIEVNGTEFKVLEKVIVTNNGNGEKFSFWPGDNNNNYSKKSQGHYGLIPTEGNNFIYYYKKTGVYTMVMVASSYDEASGEYKEDIDSVILNITSGADGLSFSKIEISTIRSGYKPRGIIHGDSISFYITNINRIEPNLSDTAFAEIINDRNLKFSLLNVEHSVYDENKNKLLGDENDPIIQFFNLESLEPIIHSYTIQAQTGEENTYYVATMFYPDLLSFSVNGINAKFYSLNGIDDATPEEQNKYYVSKADSMYIGVYIENNGGDFTKMIPEFSVSPGAVVTIEGVPGEQISGVSEVDFTKKPIIYKITKEYSGFKITKKVAVNPYIF